MPEAERVAPSRRIQKCRAGRRWVSYHGRVLLIFEAFWVLCPLQRGDQQRKAWPSLPQGEYEIMEKGFGGRMNEPFAPTWEIPALLEPAWQENGCPCTKRDAVHQPGIWEVLMGKRKCFQAWESNKTSWSGSRQNVDAEGDATSERLGSVMVIRTGYREAYESLGLGKSQQDYCYYYKGKSCRCWSSTA